MPSRRRPKTPPAAPPDPIEQFSASLRASTERQRAEDDRHRVERADAKAAARAATDHAAALLAARRELERAIDGARASRRVGSGIDAADLAWRQAKARVIELETGLPPAWARSADDPECSESGNDAEA